MNGYRKKVALQWLHPANIYLTHAKFRGQQAGLRGDWKCPMPQVIISEEQHVAVQN